MACLNTIGIATCLTSWWALWECPWALQTMCVDYGLSTPTQPAPTPTLFPASFLAACVSMDQGSFYLRSQSTPVRLEQGRWCRTPQGTSCPPGHMTANRASEVTWWPAVKTKGTAVVCQHQGWRDPREMTDTRS
ncbi:unnamed protein product [Gadus morhua 'NCC']